MELVVQQLKGNKIDLVWWPLFLGSYHAERLEAANASRGEIEDSLTSYVRNRTEVMTGDEYFEFEETLP